jgi:outer membrane protein TolC
LLTGALSKISELGELGATDYLTVGTSQTALLQTQLQELNLNTLQLAASVGLIRALGGGWKSE